MEILRNERDVRQLMNMAVLAGQILVKNGAEIYRAEDTVERLCRSCDEIVRCDSYCFPTGIFLSIEYRGESYNIFKKVSPSSYNLDKISRVNDFSRKFVNKNLEIADGIKLLNEIDELKPPESWIYGCSAAFACGFFALLFGGAFKDFIAAFISGLCVGYILSHVAKYKLTFFIENFIGAFLSALICVLLNKMGLNNNIDYSIIGAIMILVPGFPITNAARDIMSNDFMSGIIGITKAFFQAFAIATGVGLIIKFVRWFMNYFFEFFVSTCSVFAFAYYFNAPRNTIFQTGIIAGISWVIYRYVYSITDSYLAAGFFSSFFIGMSGEIFSIKLKIPATVTILPALLPLVPGAGMYYSMYYFTLKDYDNLNKYATQTTYLVVSLAIGIVASTVVARLIKLFIHSKKRKIKSQKNKAQQK